MYTFKETDQKEIQPLLEAYVSTITGINDDFWEEAVLKSRFYTVSSREKLLGFLGIQEEGLLSSFYLPRGEYRHAQPILEIALEKFRLRCAYAASTDELMLSLCMERQKAVENQAYFFRHSGKTVRPPEFDRELLALAVPGDEKDILDSEGVEENIRQEKYYTFRKDGEFLGQGFFNPAQLWPNTASIGMSVHPDHRRKGVGRSIIIHLAQMCRERGLIPICGCWYYNHNSKRTLESAGFETKTRLFKIWFTEKSEEE